MSIIIGIGVVLILLILFMIFRIGNLVGLVKEKDDNGVGSGNKINAALFLVFIAVSLALFFWYSFAHFDKYTLPVASEHGKITDSLFWITMGICVVAFALISIAM